MITPAITINSPTSAQFAAILSRHAQEISHTEDDAMISHTIISTPNGQSYGTNGHVPSDHSVMFYYPDMVKHLTVRQNQYIWSVHSAPGI